MAPLALNHYMRGMQSITTPVSSETTSGQPAAYSCTVLCGIGIACAIVFGFVIVLAIWIWLCLRRPMGRTLDDEVAEASRLYFLTHSNESMLHTSCLERASTAAPAPPHRNMHTVRDSPDVYQGLLNGAAPIAQEYRKLSASEGRLHSPHGDSVLIGRGRVSTAAATQTTRDVRYTKIGTAPPINQPIEPHKVSDYNTKPTVSANYVRPHATKVDGRYIGGSSSQNRLGRQPLGYSSRTNIATDYFQLPASPYDPRPQVPAPPHPLRLVENMSYGAALSPGRIVTTSAGASRLQEIPWMAKPPPAIHNEYVERRALLVKPPPRTMMRPGR